MCMLQKIFSKTFRNFATNADKIVLIKRKGLYAPCGYADGRHELQNTDTGGEICYDGV